MENTKVQFCIVLILFVLVNLVTYYTGDSLKINNEKGFDDSKYYQIAEKFSQNEIPSGKIPYIYRIGTPYLASRINKSNLVAGFFISNLIANFLSCVLLFTFLRLYIRNFYIMILLILLYMSHWLSNIRFIFFVPVNIEPWTTVFLIAGLILIEKFKINKSNLFILFLAGVSVVGVLFNEYIIIVPLSILFIDNPLNLKNAFLENIRKIFKNKFVLFLPLVVSIVGVIILQKTIQGAERLSYISSIIHLSFSKSLVQYLHGIFISYGSVICLLIFFYKDVFGFLKNNQQYVIILIIGFIITFAAGTEFERNLLMFHPIVLLLIGVAIKNNLGLIKKPVFIFLIVVFQSLTNRIFFPNIQSENYEGLTFPVLTVIGYGKYSYLLSSYNHFEFVFISFLEYVVVIIILMLVLRYYSLKKNFQLIS